MPLFYRNSLTQLSLPFPESERVLIKGYNQAFLFDLVESDTWIATKTVLFLTETTDSDGSPYGPEVVVLQETWTQGAFYVNGKIQAYTTTVNEAIRKYMIGVFSYERNQHGWLWAGDFKAKLEQ